jgi:hypothetical protein
MGMTLPFLQGELAVMNMSITNVLRQGEVIHSVTTSLRAKLSHNEHDFTLPPGRAKQ